MSTAPHTRDEVIAEALPEQRRWLIALATNLLRPGHEAIDDLAQEGHIAMWRAVGTYDPTREVPLPVWLQMQARRRMLDVVSRRALPTGQDRIKREEYAQERGRETRDRIRAHLRAHPHDTGRQIAEALGVSPATVSTQRKRLHLDDPEPEVGSLSALLDAGFDPAGAGDLLDAVVEGYHHGQIAAALAILTPNERRYVTLRFWEGMEAAELREEFGYDPAAVWRTAKRRLAPVLADLAAA